MTEKLYYKDVYIKEFDSVVIDVSSTDNGYDIILDKTAFFPEEGGQSSDTGYIGESEVISVYETDGVVHHITLTDPGLGEKHCVLNFDERFEKMQCHTAEHMLCGIIHRLYGLENVGFHLNDREVVFDVDGILDREQLDVVEELANAAVFANIKVETEFPDSDKLSKIQYRAKLEMTEGVRLVTIDGVDICACCAPHVGYTGEIGIIKILDFMKHRGGTRITMVAGKRAMLDYRARYENVKRISGMLSVPHPDTADAVGAMLSQNEALRGELKQARLRIAEMCAQSIDPGSEDRVFLFSDFTVPELIAFSNAASMRSESILVALSGCEGDYKYVITSKDEGLYTRAKEINSALSGRGGGRANMIQGSFSCTIEEIRKFFNQK